VPYTVTVLPAAHRGMKAVPADVQRRIIDGLDRLSENPRPPGAQRLGGPGPYRTRVGDYRIVYEIDDDRRHVRVIRIGHRREVYRRL
jgi:mRNA interferase RelE/StbE